MRSQTKAPDAMGEVARVFGDSSERVFELFLVAATVFAAFAAVIGD